MLNKLYETKEAKIKKLNLTDEQKQKLIDIFNKYNNLEKEIDWNNPDLTWSDFQDVIALAGKSKSSQKKYGIEGLTEGRDYRYLGDGYNDIIGSYKMYQPLTYEGSKVLASNKVPPIKENGAQWCIAYQKTVSYWYSYTDRGINFLFLLTDDTKFAVTGYPEGRIEVYSFDDHNLGNPQWLKKDKTIQKVLKGFKNSGLKAFEKYLTIEADGSISLLEKNLPIAISDSIIKSFIRSHIVDGKFDIKFKRWEADFDCSSTNLISLQGAPEYVGGWFSCGSCDNLTTLEGAPKKIGGNFICSYCGDLTTLKGAPREVGGRFDCRYCTRLKTLEGAPREVGGEFCCSGCSVLTSLKGSPREVGGDFYCRYTPITSLEGAPEYVGGDFYSDLK